VQQDIGAYTGGVTGTGPAEITDLLGAIARGDAAAQDALSALVYSELKRIARANLRRSRAALSLNPTTLLHEAWIKLVRTDVGGLRDSTHFFNVFAQAMRHIIIDLAKQRATVRHGGGLVRTQLSDAIETPDKPIADLIAVDAALAKLASIDAELAQLVEWHFFAGLSFAEIAHAQGVSERTVKRRWTAARALLAQLV
jgi:RNA polymerase sigma factor (TIGR02999 family)